MFPHPGPKVDALTPQAATHFTSKIISVQKLRNNLRNPFKLFNNDTFLFSSTNNLLNTRYIADPASKMAQFFQSPPPNQPQYGAQSAQNLQFYPSSYTPAPVSGHATPSQAAYGYGAPAGSPGYGSGGFNSGFGAPTGGVSGRMGEQGGLRTGWLAAFGTEGYDGEPPLLEELGVNFAHIQSKVCSPRCESRPESLEIEGKQRD